MRNKYYIVNFRGVNLLWGKVYSMTGEHSRRMITSATNSPPAEVSTQYPRGLIVPQQRYPPSDSNNNVDISII